jgi:hypothetical protein
MTRHKYHRMRTTANPFLLFKRRNSPDEQQYKKRLTTLNIVVSVPKTPTSFLDNTPPQTMPPQHQDAWKHLPPCSPLQEIVLVEDNHRSHLGRPLPSDTDTVATAADSLNNFSSHSHGSSSSDRSRRRRRDNNRRSSEKGGNFNRWASTTGTSLCDALAAQAAPASLKRKVTPQAPRRRESSSAGSLDKLTNLKLQDIPRAPTRRGSGGAESMVDLALLVSSQASMGP